MENKKKIVFEIGMILAVLAVLTVSAVPAVNAATAYFEPQHMSADPDGYNSTVLWLDLEEGETLLSAVTQIQFDPTHANITLVYKNCQQSDNECWGNLQQNFDYLGNGYFWGGVSVPQEYNEEIGEWVGTSDGLFHGPETIKICKFKLQAQGTPGVSPFNFGFEYTPSGCPLCQPSDFFNETGKPLDVTWLNGTFTHIGPEETFNKQLLAGWNLISLPLINATDMTVANIIDESLSGSYDELYKYDNTTHSYVAMGSSDTMANGVGYFINMTAANTWTYSGDVYFSMNVGLSEGLNMIGWLNCSRDIVSEGALSSIDGNYYYVSRWNATTQAYYNETYNPVAPGDFNHFTMMERGEGYFISAYAGCPALTKNC